MAVYDFVCHACDKKFEVEKTIGEFDPKAVKCPKCGSKNVERIWNQVFVETSKKS